MFGQNHRNFYISTPSSWLTPFENILTFHFHLCKNEISIKTSSNSLIRMLTSILGWYCMFIASNIHPNYDVNLQEVIVYCSMHRWIFTKVEIWHHWAYVLEEYSKLFMRLFSCVKKSQFLKINSLIRLSTSKLSFFQTSKLGVTSKLSVTS